MINVLDIRESAEMGGINTQLVSILKGQSYNKDVSVTYSYLGEQPGGWLVDKCDQMGIKLIWIPYYGPFDFLVIFRLLKLIRDLDISIIHTQHFRGDFIVWITNMLKPMSRVKTIITRHGVAGESSFRLKFYLFADRIATLSANTVIAVDQSTYFRLLDDGVKANKLKVIENPIPELRNVAREEINGLREKLGIPISNKIFLFLGRIVEQKGIFDLLEAHKVISRSNNITTLFVGNGNEFYSLVEKVNELCLTDNVKILGFQDDISLYLYLCDSLILPSYGEGSPNVVLEAISVNKPIIASSVGGIPNYVRSNFNGFLIEPGDTNGLIAAMMKIINGELDLANLPTAKSSLIAQLSPNAIYERIIEVYQDVIRQ